MCVGALGVGACFCDAVGVCRGVRECKDAWRRMGCEVVFFGGGVKV